MDKNKINSKEGVIYMSQAVTGNKEKQKKFILNDNLWRVMFQLSWPAVIAMVLYGFNAFIDGVFVGQFVGETALAGVSLAYPLTQISMGIGSLIGVGAGSALSIAIGKDDRKTQDRLMGNVNYLSLIVTVVFMILGLLFSTQLVKVMGGDGEILGIGDTYFRITIWGSFFWIYGLAGNMIVRAEGKMKSAAVMMASGLIVNVIANYIFMGILDLGVVGAAWGTNIGMFVYSLSNVIYFGKGFSSFKTKIFTICRDKEITKQIIGLGMPSLIMSVMTVIQGAFVLNAISKYGTVADIAFYGSAFRVLNFLLTPIFGLMRALQPVIGINYGARKYERAISAFKIFAVAATALTLPFWLVCMISPETILSMMSAELVTPSNLIYFRLNMSILPLLSIIFMAMTFFPAINKGKPAAMIGIARQLIFYIPVMLILPKMVGVAGVYYGSVAIDTIIVLWTAILVKKEFSSLRADLKVRPAQ